MKDWFKQLFGVARQADASASAFPAPWPSDRPGIHRFLLAQAPSRKAATLPDEERLMARRGNGLRWVAGAADGALGHHASPDGSIDATQVSEALSAALRSRSRRDMSALYDLVCGDDAIHLVDPLLEEVGKSNVISAEHLREFARWLAMESPDRGAVKVALALLGAITPPLDTPLLVTLGSHDEFTLYATVALGNTLPEDAYEEQWWSLARRVHGWGRVHLVERLSHTQRPDIKAWLLRDGYRNSIMVEYCAHPCATGGGLLDALQAPEVDDALLIGAGEILQALVNGGPAKGIDDYDDGAAACEHYLAHLSRRAPADLRHYLCAESISSFIANAHRDWRELASIGWTPEARRRIQASAARILAVEAWRTLAVGAMATDSDTDFWLASSVADKMGVDTWEARWRRQVSGQSEQWYFLMQTDGAERVRRVIALASTSLDLAAIASGAADELGLGSAYRQHAALDFILQELGRWPGEGWPLVAAGLRSPVVRNRNMALKALSDWGRAQWPPQAEGSLEAAREVEPDATTRERMDNVLAGRPLG